MKKIAIFAVTLCCAIGAAPAFAVTLVDSEDVNITSDTATEAKNIAFDNARRQIIVNALRQYVDVERLRVAVAGASASELTNLVASSGIDGEQTSDTTYSAHITMTLDNDAVRNWLNAQNIQNWIPNDAGGQKVYVMATLSNRLIEWIELNRIARELGTTVSARHIIGNQISAELPAAARGKFLTAVRDAGWHVSATDDVLRIWR